MPSGIQIFDENGRETLSPYDRIPRILGVIQGELTSGSLTNPALETGDLFYVTIALDEYSTDALSESIVTKSGTTLSWRFATIDDGDGDNKPDDEAEIMLIYGVY